MRLFGTDAGPSSRTPWGPALAIAIGMRRGFAYPYAGALGEKPRNCMTFAAAHQLPRFNRAVGSSYTRYKLSCLDRGGASRHMRRRISPSE
jgi:hypothetical protein